MNQLDFSAANRKRLDEFLSAPRRAGTLAVFDLDGTCVHNDTGEALLYHLARQGAFEFPALLDCQSVWKPFEEHPEVPSPRPEMVEFMQDPDTLPQLSESLIRAYRLLVRCAGKALAYPWAAYLLAGKTVEQARRTSREVIAAELEAPLESVWLSGGACDERPIEVHRGLRPYRAMNRLIADMRSAGMQVWIVTASNRWTAEVYAEMILNLPPERVIGMSSRVAGDVILGEPDPGLPDTFGDGKVEAIRQVIGETPVFAAGDTLNQCEMMCLASELRLIIHKGDEELLKRVAAYRSAGQDNWLVQPRFIDPPEGF